MNNNLTIIKPTKRAISEICKKRYFCASNPFRSVRKLAKMYQLSKNLFIFIYTRHVCIICPVCKIHVNYNKRLNKREKQYNIFMPVEVNIFKCQQLEPDYTPKDMFPHENAHECVI